MQVRNGIKLRKYPLVIKDGIPSVSTHLERLKRFIALLTSTAEIGSVSKKSEVTEWEEVMVGEVILKIDSEWLIKTFSMRLESVTK
jgi:hypothetical protein